MAEIKVGYQLPLCLDYSRSVKSLLIAKGSRSVSSKLIRAKK